MLLVFLLLWTRLGSVSFLACCGISHVLLVYLAQLSLYWDNRCDLCVVLVIRKVSNVYDWWRCVCSSEVALCRWQDAKIQWLTDSFCKSDLNESLSLSSPHPHLHACMNACARVYVGYSLCHFSLREPVVLGLLFPNIFLLPCLRITSEQWDFFGICRNLWAECVSAAVGSLRCVSLQGRISFS